MLYQFTARGHDVTQALLGQMLTGARDGVGVYYRSRPLMLALGLTVEDALASTMMRSGSVSEGRDIGVVFNLPRREGRACCRHAAASALSTRRSSVGRSRCSISPGSARRERCGQHRGCARRRSFHCDERFLAALTIATTQRLPMLFFLEDNGYGISVKSEFQTPGGNIAANLAAFRNLKILEGDSANPRAAAAMIENAVAAVRSGEGPVLLRLLVPRLSGHSGQDTQAYKSADEIAAERSRDPLVRLREQLVPATISEESWRTLETRAREDVRHYSVASATSVPDAANVTRMRSAKSAQTAASMCSSRAVC